MADRVCRRPEVRGRRYRRMCDAGRDEASSRNPSGGDEPMQTQPQVSFDDIPIDEAVRDAALDHIAQLEGFSDRITGCHVVIAQPHRHHREGRLYSVRVDVRVPGGEIVVNRDHHLDHAHEDVFVALRDSFRAARRRLEDRVRRLRGVEKSHAPRTQGHVAQIFPLQEYGFIQAADGREIYFHRRSMSDNDFRTIDVGSPATRGRRPRSCN
ncbi:MAG: HPF/RaiA family ribosome-associated protein [Planctomycetia bacterium]|nr:HPF/RaiA family ribosome-associated protein [Planctomycetia bacterium]